MERSLRFLMLTGETLKTRNGRRRRFPGLPCRFVDRGHQVCGAHAFKMPEEALLEGVHIRRLGTWSLHSESASVAAPS